MEEIIYNLGLFTVHLSVEFFKKDEVSDGENQV
jgi:hypothetical protein